MLHCSMEACLPTTRLLGVASRLASAVGVVDEDGLEQPWVRWAYEGAPSFGAAWGLHEAITIILYYYFFTIMLLLLLLLLFTISILLLLLILIIIIILLVFLFY